MVVTNLDSVYMPEGGRSSLQVAVLSGEAYSLSNSETPEFTKKTSVKLPYYSNESKHDQIDRITDALLSNVRSDLYDSNFIDISSRRNMGDTTLDAHYFATLDLDHKTIKLQSPNSTNIKDKAAKWFADVIGSNVSVNLPATEVSAIGTYCFYKRQEPQQTTTA